jgi:hypothetical protein
MASSEQSSPIVQHKDAGPTITGVVVAMHGDRLENRAEAPRYHHAISFVKAHAHAGDESLGTTVEGKFIARI